jgi:hypothetical protein
MSLPESREIQLTVLRDRSVNKDCSVDPKQLIELSNASEAIPVFSLV